MNTLLFIEPRMIEYCVSILNEYYKILGNDWKYVFYCGKGTLSYWTQSAFVDELKRIIEFRELNVENMTPYQYNDFLKNRDLWESLTGDFVLTAQVDTWPMNMKPHTIDYFIKLNKSYIGGNMSCHYNEMKREKMNVKVMNFNGGLSLRKRLDMLKVIDTFPPEPSINSSISTKIETDAEDVYFSVGCYKINLPIGDDEESSHFAVHSLSKDTFFGIHNPHGEAGYTIRKRFPELCGLNPWLKLENAYYIPDLD